MGKLSGQLSRLNLSQSQFDEIADLVRNRILSLCQPQRIYIFGSYARGTPHHFSDLDIAVIFEKNEDVIKGKKIILRSKLFLDYSVDILFYSIDDFIKKAQTGGVCSLISSEGKIIYDQGTKV